MVDFTDEDRIQQETFMLKKIVEFDTNPMLKPLLDMSA
jgi:hypothetical protein